MSDMRLVVAGAGGRMGRTLIHALAASEGATLTGAVEAAGSAVIGREVQGDETGHHEHDEGYHQAKPLGKARR